MDLCYFCRLMSNKSAFTNVFANSGLSKNAEVNNKTMMCPSHSPIWLIGLILKILPYLNNEKWLIFT